MEISRRRFSSHPFQRSSDHWNHIIVLNFFDDKYCVHFMLFPGEIKNSPARKCHSHLLFIYFETSPTKCICLHKTWLKIWRHLKYQRVCSSSIQYDKFLSNGNLAYWIEELDDDHVPVILTNHSPANNGSNKHRHPRAKLYRVCVCVCVCVCLAYTHYTCRSSSPLHDNSILIRCINNGYETLDTEVLLAAVHMKITSASTTTAWLPCE